MKVRVVDEILSPSVQDGEETDFGAEVLWVCGSQTFLGLFLCKRKA